VDLATRFNGEVINGDAMQLYRGLPTITNQIPVEERNGIPHHLIGRVELDEEPWRIGPFRKESLRLIADIQARGKLPILVGGTHYYTQAVLFNEPLVGEVAESCEQDAEEEDDSTSAKWPILDAPTDVVLQKLREVDPVMADRWHPNESRKIRRSLEVYFQTGRPASEIYAEQKRLTREAMARDGVGAGPGQLRFRTMVLWVHAEKETLNSRLDRRVDAMVDQGLIPEARQMAEYIQAKEAQGVTIDQTRGVWVAIGFKELAPYLNALADGSLGGDELEAVKRGCIESVKTATRKYATSQTKWIRNKLWTSLAEVGMAHRLYLLDSSDVDDWDKCVAAPSEMLVQSLLADEPAPDPKSLSELARVTLEAKEAQSKGSEEMPKCIICETCNRTMTGEEQWNIHIRSHAHKRGLKAARKRAGRAEHLRRRESTQEDADYIPDDNGRK
jgi:tRNA dimethylallyltransferase